MKNKYIRKTIYSLLAASMMLGSAAGCGNNDIASDTSASQEASESVESGSTEAGAVESEASEEAAGADAKNQDENELAEADIIVGNYNNELMLHDPHLFVGEDGGYYMYGSHCTGAKGTKLDMSDWDMLYKEPTRPSTKMFEGLFDGLDGENLPEAFQFVGRNESNQFSVWAPSVIYNKKMGKYLMYFCTSSTYIKSSLCLASSDNPEGPWKYEKVLLSSGFTKRDIDQTNFYEVMGEEGDYKDYLLAGGYNNQLFPNCIDPQTFYDADGRMWMVYGSWSGGIFLLEIDEETGDVIHPEPDENGEVDKYFGRRLLGGGHHAMEGPYIEYVEETGYYYLFLSYGGLARDGGYQIRILRSKNVEGPYEDAKGEKPDNTDTFSQNGIKLVGNYDLPSIDMAYKAPGGQSTFRDADGKLYVVYHERFDKTQEDHEPRIHRLFTTKDGWLVMAPFQTNGSESLSESGLTNDDICGTYYMLNHGLKIDDKVLKAEASTFSTDGQITGSMNGTFQVEEGSNYISLDIDGVKYEGVIMDMVDEAGNNVRCISAIGNNNTSIWGVHYVK
ncbi:MAG: glycoside hydrolase family 43 protein [Eubacterium sp.]|nr:glycoside hydrolase family 43 protein [Eubacterium sp.]